MKAHTRLSRISISPGIDEFQCLKKVKEKWPLVEVGILTGYASNKSGIEGMQGGAFDYYIKPIDTEELVGELELAAQKALINKQKATGRIVERGDKGGGATTGQKGGKSLF